MSCKPMPSVLPACDRLIAIGDLHGDWRVTRKIFINLRLIDFNDKWIAEPLNTVVVQVGDILDRGGRPETHSDECSELKIMDFLDEIHSKAKLYGGGIYCILGNHEIMNVFGNFDYSSPQGVKCFGGKEKRRELFRPGGEIARRFACTRNAILKVGNFMFVHAGVVPKHLKYKKSIEEINEMMRNFLNGDTLDCDEEFKDIFLAFEGILWNREMAIGRPDCNNLKKVLNYFNVGSMIVGHTIQPDGIKKECGVGLWKVDVGMSAAFGEDNKLEVLEILNDGVPSEKNKGKPFKILHINS